MPTFEIDSQKGGDGRRRKVAWAAIDVVEFADGLSLMSIWGLSSRRYGTVTSQKVSVSSWAASTNFAVKTWSLHQWLKIGLTLELGGCFCSEIKTMEEDPDEAIYVWRLLLSFLPVGLVGTHLWEMDSETIKF